MAEQTNISGSMAAREAEASEIAERALIAVRDSIAQAYRLAADYPDVAAHLERAAKETGSALGYLYLYRSGRKRAKK